MHYQAYKHLIRLLVQLEIYYPPEVQLPYNDVKVEALYIYFWTIINIVYLNIIYFSGVGITSSIDYKLCLAQCSVQDRNKVISLRLTPDAIRRSNGPLQHVTLPQIWLIIKDTCAVSC